MIWAQQTHYATPQPHTSHEQPGHVDCRFRQTVTKGARVTVDMEFSRNGTDFKAR
jgi:hypothetical protein